jgi:hypothetical protein
MFEKVILNHKKIRSIMREKRIRKSDFAKMISVSPQMAHYILSRGSIKYAIIIAHKLGVDCSDITTTVPIKLRLPPGVKIVNNRVRNEKLSNYK